MHRKTFVASFLVVFVNVFLADSLSRHYGHSWAFWLIGGALMGLGGQLTLVPKEKRTLSSVILATVLTAVVASAAALVAGLITQG